MKTISRLFITLALAACLTTGLSANGLNLNGFGARATAMGGAYVSLANDFTAIFWNPAGLTQLTKAQFGLSADLLIPSAKYGIGTFSMETKSKMYPAGMLGYAQPIGENIVVGLGAYTLSGLGAAWDNTGLEAALVYPYPPAAFTPTLEAYKWESFIGSVTLAPTIAVKVNEILSFGASFNLNYGFFKTDQWGEFVIVGGAPAGGNLMAPPILVNLGLQTLDVKGWGYGATFGVMVKPADMISFGATFRTQSKMKLKGKMEIENVGLLGLADSSNAEMEVVSPMWLAGGVAVKPVDGLTLAFDAQYTNWAKLTDIAIHFTDPVWDAALGPDAMLGLHWANKTQLRFGAEYDFGAFALRGGYYYDPAPAPDSTMNILTPSFTYNSLAFGFGYKAGGLKLDVALEYLMGKDRNITAGALPGAYEMNILVPVAALTFNF